jgi:hypothetical protein
MEETVCSDKDGFREEYTVVDGCKHGVYKAWEGNYLLTVSNYSNGLLHGLSNKYNRNGKVQEETLYKHGNKHGACKFYFAPNMFYQYNYLNNIQQGEHALCLCNNSTALYYKDGVETSEDEYNLHKANVKDGLSLYGRHLHSDTLDIVRQYLQ